MPILPSDKKTIVISSGDPSGIGPEIVIKSLFNIKFFKYAKIVVVGSVKVFKIISDILGIRFEKRRFDFVDVNNVPIHKFRFGTISKLYGRASLDYILCSLAIVQSLNNSALVTAPISKASFHRSGIPFNGHTELLSYLTDSKDETMFLAGGRLRVALVTRHIPLKDVHKKITKIGIIATFKNTYLCLKKYFRISEPRIAIASLNPHGGENGLLGKEEKNIIVPASRIIRKRFGKSFYGTFPADTVFYKAYHGEVDAVICMYHDQALIPLKMIAFNRGVNLTLGLPFIRTSPDHGTAFDIAGKGVADYSSMAEAIRLAIKLLPA